MPFFIYVSGKALQYLDKTMFSAQHGDRPDVKNVAIIITDGKSTDSSDTKKQALESRKDGIQLYAVGIGSSVDDKELLHITGSSQHVVHANNFDVLKTVLKSIKSDACSEAEGWHGSIFTSFFYSINKFIFPSLYVLLLSIIYRKSSNELIDIHSDIIFLSILNYFL